MKSSRKIDALIAKKIFNWKNVRCLPGGNIPAGEPDDDYNQDHPNNPHTEWVPEYSRDIYAACEVVCHAKPDVFGVYTVPDMDYSDQQWACEWNDLTAYARTPQEAICKAALKSVGVDLTHSGSEPADD